MSLISKHIIKLDWVKSTKNTEVYRTDEEVAVNQLYIRKSAFSGDAPNSIIVTIESGDNNG